MNTLPIYNDRNNTLTHAQVVAILTPYLDSEVIKESFGYYGKIDKNAHNYLFEFLHKCTLKDLQLQKSIFIKNKDVPEFKGLLFFLAKWNSPDFLKKITTLLKWGYDPNVSLGETSYSDYFYSPYLNKLDKGTKPIHLLNNVSHLKLFASHGADMQVKNQYYPFMKAFAQSSALDKIQTCADLITLHDYAKDNTSIEYIKHIQDGLFYVKQYSPHEKIPSIIKDWTDEINRELEISMKPLSIYEYNKLCGPKTLIQFLKQFEPSDNLLNEERQDYDKILKASNKDKIKLLDWAIKKDNQYVLDRLSTIDLKELNSKTTFIHKTIKSNSLNWLKHIVENGLLDVYEHDYLRYAYDNIKTKPFIYLYSFEKTTDKVQAIVDSINKTMKSMKGYNTDQDILAFFPKTIISFLAKEGYHFDNSIILSQIIKDEKENLTQILQDPILDNLQEKKRFKL